MGGSLRWTPRLCVFFHSSASHEKGNPGTFQSSWSIRVSVAVVVCPRWAREIKCSNIKNKCDPFHKKQWAINNKVVSSHCICTVYTQRVRFVVYMYTKQLAVLVRLGQNRWLGFYQFQTKSYIRDEITYTEFWRMWKNAPRRLFSVIYFFFMF